MGLLRLLCPASPDIPHCPTMPYMPYSKMYMPYSKNKNDILTCPTVTKKISLHALQQKKKYLSLPYYALHALQYTQNDILRVMISLG